MPQRTVVSGSQPASRAEQARITAAETVVVLRVAPCRMNLLSSVTTKSIRHGPGAESCGCGDLGGKVLEPASGRGSNR